MIPPRSECEALAEFDKSLAASPKRFNSLYGAGKAAALLQDSAGARGYFGQLVTLCQPADSERPELLAAKRFVAQQN